MVETGSTLQTILAARRMPSSDVRNRTREIFEAVLDQSRFLDGPNFRAFHTSDLELLFDLYDARFLDGTCRRQLGTTPLRFRISRRMTRIGGKMTHTQVRRPGGGVVHREYEISVSATLLFQTFHDESRPITVCGVVCQNRLEALQRVFEHETVHLCETLAWNESNCSAARFQSIASRIFAHTEHTHRLITPHERALTRFGIRTGDRVAFRLDGRHLEGVVNRITRRATVLVEDPQGDRYSDGKKYAKFYVPLTMLQRVARV